MKTLRDQGNPQAFYRDDHLFVDLRHQVLILDNQALALTRIEYGLLALLVSHTGKVVPRLIFLMEVWG